MSGPATQKILYREFYDYGDERYQRLSTISAPHIYNLRKSRVYRERRGSLPEDRPVQVSIGERRRPDPQGRPGYLRIDTVHQGDLDGPRGVPHQRGGRSDAVAGGGRHGADQRSLADSGAGSDAAAVSVPHRGFHSDNGSEFINHTVAKLLNKLLVEQTKSRPRHSNDNGPGGSQERSGDPQTHGYGHIESQHAEASKRFMSGTSTRI